MEVGKLLKLKRKELGWNISQASARSGVSTGHISRIENQHRTPSFLIVQKLSAAYGLDICKYNDKASKNKNFSLLKDSSIALYEVSKQVVPIVGNVSECGEIRVGESTEALIPLPDFLQGKADYAIRVKDDSLNSMNIYKGDVLFVKKTDKVKNFDLSVILIKGSNELIVRQYYNTQNVITLLPKSNNPDYSPLAYPIEKADRVTVLGKVVYAIIKL